jgi:GNAT superfamily N-acetyltransferase
MNLQIRRATLADAEQIADHNAAMARETENVQLDPQRLRLGVDAVLNDPAKGFYTVAEAEGRAVGQMMVTFEWSDWRNATFWWVQSVYVEPAYRRRGVYRRLYEHVLAEAKSRNDVCGVRLYVDKDNRAAQQVYQRLGLNPAHYTMYEVDFVLNR